MKQVKKSQLQWHGKLEDSQLGDEQRDNIENAIENFS